MSTTVAGVATSARRAVCRPGGREIALMHHGMNKINIGVCETQPVTAEGLRVLLASQEELTCRWIVPNLMVGLQLARQQPVHALLVDKGFGQQAVGLAITEVNACVPGTGVVVWGNSMSESEALRLLQSGARGLLRKTSDLATVTACLRSFIARRLRDMTHLPNLNALFLPGARPYSTELLVAPHELPALDSSLPPRQSPAPAPLAPATEGASVSSMRAAAACAGRWKRRACRSRFCRTESSP